MTIYYYLKKVLRLISSNEKDKIERSQVYLKKEIVNIMDEGMLIYN